MVRKKIKKKKKTNKKYIFAYDPTIKKRVTYEIKNGWAISMVTGHKFKYNPKKR